MRLTGRDHHALQQCLGRLYAHMDLEAFPGQSLAIMRELVPCNMAAYNEVDPIRRRIVAVFDPVESQSKAAPLLPTWEKLMHQHPLVTHFRDNPNDHPRKITDFVSQSAYEQLDIYREVYRHIDGRYQIVTIMPAPSPLVVGIAQNRGDRDFSERDRRVLTVLRPHLRQAYENACVVSELQDKARQLEQVIDRIDRAVVILDERGGVLHASPAAIRFIGEYLPREHLTAVRLPDTLAGWAVSQIAALRREGDADLRPSPLMFDGAHGRLVMRLIADTKPGRFVIVMHHAARLASAEPLRGLGLTEREAEVLYWCVEGKTRAEIGILLHISDRTVQKHLEHIYAKLDVPNRVAAVTKAIEWLRW